MEGKLCGPEIDIRDKCDPDSSDQMHFDVIILKLLLASLCKLPGPKEKSSYPAHPATLSSRQSFEL